MLIYILTGLLSLTFAVGGLKKLAEEFNLKNTAAAILLTAVLIGAAIPSIKLSGRIYLSIGGTLLLLYALISVFYRNKFIRQLFIVYISFILGILFFALQKWVLGVEISTVNRSNILLYAVFILLIMLFSDSSKTAFAVSVLSCSISGMLFGIQVTNADYVIGGGDNLILTVTVFTFAAVLSYFVRRTVLKLYPKPKEILFEASEEFAPDDEKYDKK